MKIRFFQCKTVAFEDGTKVVCTHPQGLALEPIKAVRYWDNPSLVKLAESYKADGNWVEISRTEAARLLGVCVRQLIPKGNK